MKKFIRTITLSSVLLSSLFLHAAFEPPTEGDLDQLLANPKLINVTIKDANGQEAAGVVLRIIQRLQAAELNESQLKYLVSLYTSRTVFLLPSTEARAFATEIMAKAPLELRPTIMAAMSIGAGGVPGFADYLRELAGEDAAMLDALVNPSLPLTPPVYNLLLRALGTTQSLPSVIVDSLPPPIPVGLREQDASSPPLEQPSAPPEPPIGEPYVGQSGEG